MAIASTLEFRRRFDRTQHATQHEPGEIARVGRRVHAPVCGTAQPEHLVCRHPVFSRSRMAASRSTDAVPLGVETCLPESRLLSWSWCRSPSNARAE